MSVDRHVRERAARDLERSMFLAAGAGSGKTSVLVDRVVALVQSGVPPRRIAAITFTEKAARELQERVRDDLERALAGATGERAQRLAHILERYSELTISTIHGFCRELLASEALESGWAPGTEIVAEVFSPSAVQRALHAWRRELDVRLGPPGLEIRRRVDPYGLEAAARARLEHRDLAVVVGPAAVDWDGAHDELVRHRAQLDEARGRCLAPERCTLVNNNAALLDAIAAACTAPAQPGLRAILDCPYRPNRRGGRGADWPTGSLSQFKEALTAFEEWRQAMHHRLLEPLHHALMRDLDEHLVPAVERAKRRMGQVDFADLLLRAASLLRDSPGVRARLAQRFRAILVDELQDTDPIQAEVVALLARHPEQAGAWADHAPRPGHLFLVGDTKQSIYRFRRADLAVSERLGALIERDGERLALSQNFRSVPGLVAFVNFAYQGFHGHPPQVAFRPPAALDPVVRVAATPDAEADAALRHLLDLRARGATVVDREQGQPRPLRWRDVMIVLPSWTSSEAIQDRFVAAGVGCAIEGGNTFFQRDEVRLAMAALRAIDEPGDSRSIAFVLRGLFGLSHEDLARHVAQGGRWRYTVPDQPAGPVLDALQGLEKLRRRSGGRSAVRTLDELLEATGAPAVWSLTARGTQALGNLDKLRELIRRVECSARTTGELLEVLDALAKAEEPELPLADPELDAVRVTTLFKAKGLEAPIVVVLHAARQVRAGAALIDRANGEIAIRCGALQPPEWDRRVQRDKEEQLEERRRWMYVAATRARDQLVIVDAGRSDLLKPDLEQALSGLDQASHDALMPLAEGVAVRCRQAAQLPPPPHIAETFPGLDAQVDVLVAAPPAGGDAEGEAWEAARRTRRQAAMRACSSWRSVTQLVRRSRSGRAAGDGRDGKRVHAVMEQLDLGADPAALAQCAREVVADLAIAEGLGAEHAAKIGEVVMRLLAHPIVERARRAPERWQEVPFAYPYRGGQVGGVIDLCFPEDSERRRWVVVDWKGELPPEGHPDRTRYEHQLAHYAQALLATLAPAAPIESVERVLVGPHPELRHDAAQLAVEHVGARWRTLLGSLLDSGIAVPDVGLDVGDPVFACLELAWPAEWVALAPQLADADAQQLRDMGWRLVRADTPDPSVEDQLRALLGAPR